MKSKNIKIHHLNGLAAHILTHNAIPHANADEDFEEFGGAEIPAALEDDCGVSLEDQRVHHEVGVALPGSITVNRIELTSESSLRNLRAACSVYKIGQSGGKAKCYGRLIDHQKKQRGDELLMTRRASSSTSSHRRGKEKTQRRSLIASCLRARRKQLPHGSLLSLDFGDRVPHLTAQPFNVEGDLPCFGVCVGAAQPKKRGRLSPILNR